MYQVKGSVSEQVLYRPWYLSVLQPDEVENFQHRVVLYSHRYPEPSVSSVVRYLETEFRGRSHMEQLSGKVQRAAPSAPSTPTKNHDHWSSAASGRIGAMSWRTRHCTGTNVD
ncbi:hypothetical protein INR49_006837 [Caranx melampygus]|nr:hypothetical protein INR49_006837 [Caranx melampygus]